MVDIFAAAFMTAARTETADTGAGHSISGHSRLEGRLPRRRIAGRLCAVGLVILLSVV